MLRLLVLALSDSTAPEARRTRPNAARIEVEVVVECRPNTASSVACEDKGRAASRSTIAMDTISAVGDLEGITGDGMAQVTISHPGTRRRTSRSWSSSIARGQISAEDREISISQHRDVRNFSTCA